MLAAMNSTNLIPVAQTAIAVPAAEVDAIAGLKTGQIVTAKVLEILGQSLARLDIGGSKIDVRSQTPLDIGTLLSLKVERSGTLTRLVPVPQQAARPAAGGDAAMRSSAVVLSGRASVPAPSSSSVPAPASVPSSSSTAPSASAMDSASAQRPAADGSAQGPRPVQAGDSGGRGAEFNPVRALQAKLAIDAASILKTLKSVNNLPQSPSQSAAKTEASTGTSSAQPAGSASPATSEKAVGAAAQKALATQIPLDAGRQASAALVFADAARLLAQAPDKLPGDVRDALTKLLGFRLPSEKPLSGEAVRSAFHKSGVLLEAKLGQAVRQMEAGQTPQLPGGDLKSSLLDLKQKLSQFLKTLSPDEAASKPAARGRAGNLPPPPVRSGAVKGQMAAEPAVTPRMSGGQAAQVLMEETRSAISRLRLLQNASLPVQSDSSSGRSGLARIEWNFEIPLAFGERTDMAQLRIEGEGSEDVDPARRLWSVHVGLDTEETGQVSGAVMLQGKAVSVNLMAARPEMAEQFQARLGELKTVLREAGLEVDRVQIRHGVRKTPQTPPGHMVDSSQ